MRRDMHDSAVRSVCPQNVFTRGGTCKELCARQNGLKSFDLIGYRRRLRIRDAED